MNDGRDKATMEVLIMQLMNHPFTPISRECGLRLIEEARKRNDDRLE